MLNLTIGDYAAIAVPVVTAGWAFYQDVLRRRDAHKLTIAADLEKQKYLIDAEVKKEELRVQGEVDKEKARTQAEVEKIRERGMGGEAVVKIWQVVDEIQGDVEKLEENQNKDHTDNIIRNQIVTKLSEEVTKFTTILFENLITRK